MENVSNVLKDDIPVVPETDDQTEKDKKDVELTQWEHNDYLFKNYILNGLANDLYDYYSSDNNTTKQVWDALKKKYDTEEVEAKTYVVSHYIKYQMTDQWKLSIMKSRKLFTRSSLKESRKQDQKYEVLLVENNQKKKFIEAVLKPNGKQLKNHNRTLKKNNKNGNPQKIAIGAPRHVCYDRAMFKIYIVVEDKKVLLGDSHTTNVVGIGDVELIFTSRKTLILKNVMHTPEIRKNLVYGFLLNKAGFT
ncbi:uncharacterized protein [Cicer arietinum]|uniref:uncharacterized protein n=1 Tax=Cicer arietinum TaxID=3827 RepID=UPI003CC5EF9F